MLNVFVDPGGKWRMTAESLSGGAATQLMCSVNGLPFMLTP